MQKHIFEQNYVVIIKRFKKDKKEKIYKMILRCSREDKIRKTINQKKTWDFAC